MQITTVRVERKRARFDPTLPESNVFKCVSVCYAGNFCVRVCTVNSLGKRSGQLSYVGACAKVRVVECVYMCARALIDQRERESGIMVAVYVRERHCK